MKGEKEMALIECPSCGKGISHNAFKCMHCGYELKVNTIESAETVEQKVTTSNRRLDYNKIAKIAIVVGLILWVFGFIKNFILENHDLYILIINAISFVGLAIMGGGLIISGLLIILYDELRKHN